MKLNFYAKRVDMGGKLFGFGVWMRDMEVWMLGFGVLMDGLGS